MNKNSKIFIAGHNGMVGSAILRKLKNQSYENLIIKTRSQLDLTQQSKVEAFFEKEQPEYVFVAAAKVGGILANDTYPAEFIYQNLQIQNNLIHSAHQCKVKKLLFLGSSCIYPRECPQPMKEEYLLTGLLEPTNEAYAIAKIAGIKMCQFYYRQFKSNFISIMPTNLYGPEDNFDLEKSHVLPALIRKFHEAKIYNQKSVIIWGTGIAKREFLFVDDMADASIFIMNNVEAKELYEKNISHINVGTGMDISIGSLAEMVKKIVGFTGEIIYDTTKPDGMLKKQLDITRLKNLGWEPETELNDGINKAYKWYIEHLVS